ncbi:hypothetical protein [Janibacter melonis]|uniref:hypothetical protein n=1 Tax=Janibacter melonis TaxID=262209 RepID=UPI00177BB080|nr:hypothetical protein [Janibacter melonis]
MSVVVVSSCSSPTDDWRFEGQEVTDVDTSLESLTGRYRDFVADLDFPSAVPPEAGCFVQVVADSAVQDVVLCGPMRFAGDEEDVWLGMPVALAPGDGGSFVLDAADDAQFADAEPTTGAKLLDGEGSPAATDVEIATPASPRADVGEAVPLPTEGGEDTQEPVIVEVPDATYSIADAAATDHVGQGRGRVDAPEGGALLSVGVDRSARSDAPNGETSTATLYVDDEEVEIPEDGTATAVAGAPSSARLVVEYDGAEQVVRLAEPAEVQGVGYVDEHWQPVNDPQDERIGDEGKGAFVEYDYDVIAHASTWDEDRSWVDDGKVRLDVDVSFDAELAYRESGNGSLDYDEVAYDVQEMKVVAGGDEVPVDVDDLEVVPRPDGDYSTKSNVVRVSVEVDDTVDEISVEARVSADGRYERSDLTSYQRGQLTREPSKITGELELAETVVRARQP